MKKRLFRLLAAALLGLPILSSAADGFTLVELIQRTFDNYPELALTDLDIEHARQQLPQVESRNGYVLGGKSGYSRDLSFIGTPSDTFTVAGELNRKLSSGETIALSGSYRREDNSGGAVFRGYPNPANNIDIDLDFRYPFWRGEGNPDYRQGKIIAGKQVGVAEANRVEQLDRLASQAIDLFYGALFTRYRLENSREAIARARRLGAYIEKKYELGLAEQKDRLQTEARLRAEQARHQSLMLDWQQKRIAINRLTGRPWNEDVRLLSQLEQFPVSAGKIDSFVAEAEEHSPLLSRGRDRLEIAAAVIEQRRDARRDKLDLVVSAGIRNLSGSAPGNSIDRTALAGGVSIEYQRALDRRGFDAALYQAQLERDRIVAEMEAERYRLRYQVSSLVSGIQGSRKAVQSYQKRLASEVTKYRQAEHLFREARFDTSLLLQYEGELRAADLALQQQRIDLLKRYALLALLRGKLYR